MSWTNKAVWAWAWGWVLTPEDFEQYNKRRQEFYKFFSSKQLKFFLILRETDNYYLDSYFMNKIRDAGAV